MRSPALRSLVACAMFAIACGGGAGAPSNGSAARSGAAGSSPTSAAADGGATAPSGPIDLVGVWSVAGSDARGAFHGSAELRREGGALRFFRAVRYDDARVEDGRRLEWAFVGDAHGDPAHAVDADVVLDSRDFLRERNGVVRTVNDAPERVHVSIAVDGAGATARYAGASADTTERWTDEKSAGASPLVVVDRARVPAHDPPSAAEKAALFAAYASYRALPDVAPYAQRPDFQAAIHEHVVDKSDFDFYRANRDALRVVNKRIDAVSLGETLARANAYRATLAEKAATLDAEIEADFVDPATGMLYDGFAAGQPKHVHYSAALWTGMYAASQAFRWEVTHDAKAKSNFLLALDGLLELQEVTGDWKVFARAIRPASGNVGNGWSQGAGALANREWLAGGNNDMMKGLYVAYVLGYRLLCQAPGEEAICARIRTNAGHLADDVRVAQGSDDVDSPWLAAAVADDPVKKLAYQAKAEAAWVVAKPILQNNTRVYEQGAADWSGLHLGFAASLFHVELATLDDLGGNARATVKGIIDDTWSSIRRQRLPLWNELHAAFGTPDANDAAALDDVRWRLREFPCPKTMQLVDHRVSPEFSLSPYPSAPWKNDWTTTDRTQSLRTYPLFEDAMDVYRFRLEMQYRGDTTLRFASPEYLLAYWFARRENLIGAAD